MNKNYNPHGLTIGQKLYEPPIRRSTLWNEYVVTKLGRQWATLGTGPRAMRCSLDKLMLDCNGYAPRPLYKSKETYEKNAALQRAWRELLVDMQAKIPEGTTLEDIAEIRSMLGIPPRKEE